MASIAEVLEHLVQYAPALSEERRQEFLDVIEALRPGPAVQAPPLPADPPAAVNLPGWPL